MAARSSAMAVDATRHITAIVDRILRVALIVVIVCSPILNVSPTVGMLGFLGALRGAKSLRLTY